MRDRIRKFERIVRKKFAELAVKIHEMEKDSSISRARELEVDIQGKTSQDLSSIGHNNLENASPLSSTGFQF